LTAIRNYKFLKCSEIKVVMSRTLH